MKIQLKRSNQLQGSVAKEPSINYMEYGELAVNFNTADPAIFVRASDGAGNDSIVRIAGSGAEAGGMPSGPSVDRPSAPSPGDLYFDTDLNAIIYWNGTSWQPISASTIVADGTVGAPSVGAYPAGTLWFNSAETEAQLYVLYEDPSPLEGRKWVQVGSGGGGGSGGEVLVDQNPPVIGNLPEGTLWWDSSDTGGELYILYADPSDSQFRWVVASPAGPTESGGSEVLIQDTIPAPSIYDAGTLWWNSSSDDCQLYVLYDDPAPDAGKKWVEASPTAGATDDYVLVDGDNMTGNLTIGGDKIELKTDGSATFAGDVFARNEATIGANYASDDAGVNVFLNGKGTDNAAAAVVLKSKSSLSTTNSSALIVKGKDNVNTATLKYDGSSLQHGQLELHDYSAGADDYFILGKSDIGTSVNNVVDKFSVKADGSATFAGTVNSTYSPGGGGYGFALLQPGGANTAGGLLQFDGGASQLVLKSVWGGAETVTLDGSDGTASFAGGLAKIDRFGQIDVNTPTNDGFAFASRVLNGAATCTIEGSGSATFAGEVTVANEPNSGAAPGVQLQTAGVVSACRAGTAPLFYGWQEGNSTETSYITADGSAAFAGTVEVKRINAGSTTHDNHSLVATNISTVSASVYARNNASTTAPCFVAADGPANENVVIYNNGSATFEGNVRSGSSTFTGPGTAISSTGNIYIQAAANDTSSAVSVVNTSDFSNPVVNIRHDGSATFQGNITAGNVSFNLDPDNSANYVSTTDADGNSVQVYNGPTLNVKDRIQNLISRMDAIEADEINDDATSSALLTLVAGLSSDMQKTKAALVAIRTAANVAGTLEQLKSDIATATADI